MIRFDELNYLNNKDPLSYVSVECGCCKIIFKAKRLLIQRALKAQKKLYCSRNCSSMVLRKYERNHFCTNCKVQFVGLANTKSVNRFCSKSCSATYNNKHKSFGIRRSKLEIYIEEQLTSIYPSLEIHYNRKDTINSELDIYIPSLKVAVELNGIFHYEPIFSSEQLAKSKNNDERKMQACLERGVELCVINTSHQKVFNPETSAKFLNIIRSIIDRKSTSPQI
jgi:hypothetical protein